MPRCPKLTKESQDPDDAEPKTDCFCRNVSRGHATKYRYYQTDSDEHAA
jgi:hypothetical protein